MQNSCILSAEQIAWHFIPMKYPHQGGLWEAGVREMKRSLNKIIKGHRLRSDDLVTILTDVSMKSGVKKII